MHVNLRRYAAGANFFLTHARTINGVQVSLEIDVTIASNKEIEAFQAQAVALDQLAEESVKA